MKKIKSVWLTGMLMLLSLGLVSCSDDDNGGIGSTSDLIGTWEQVSEIYQLTEDGKIIESESGSKEYNGDSYRLTFREDGTVRGEEYDDDYGEYYFDGESRWSYEDGKLTLDGVTMTVKKLTSSKLVLEDTEKFTEDGVVIECYYLAEYRKISN